MGCDGELLFLMPKNTGTADHNTLINIKHNIKDMDEITFIFKFDKRITINVQLQRLLQSLYSLCFFCKLND